MKKLLLFVGLAIVHLNAFSQQFSQLVGAHHNASTNVFSALDISGNNYQQISSLPAALNFSGQTTFDDKHQRYFVKSNSSILIINASTGNIIDSIPNVGAFYNMEYDEKANCLIGMVATGTVITIKVYDVATKIGTSKSTLPTSDSIIVGESTFDAATRRYFTTTNVGVIVVDSNGVQKDVLCSSPVLKGIEYCPLDNKLYYMEWAGLAYNLVAIESDMCTINVPGAYLGLVNVETGESTFDKTLGHYYTITNLGLLQINAVNGVVVQTLTPVNNFKGMEFFSATSTGLNVMGFGTQDHVFPNPGKGVFYFRGLENGSLIEVFDVEGKMIYQSIVNQEPMTIDLTGTPKGIYFYTTSDSNHIVRTGKLMIDHE